jgi:DNA primase small subunit
VANEAVETLDALARKEIVDYLLGLGLDTSFHGLDNRNLKVAKPYEGLTLDDVGWRRHIALAVQSFLSTADEQTLVNVGIGRKEVRIILQDKNMFLKHWLEKKAMGTMKGVGPATWTKIIERCVQLQSIGIDTVVTTDVHRLIRLQDTLHSKTGFKKAELRVSAIDSFDPFDSAVAFEEGNRTVLVSSAPEFRLGGRKFGPYKNEKVELPTAAAVLLACRDRGEVVA